MTVTSIAENSKFKQIDKFWLKSQYWQFGLPIFVTGPAKIYRACGLKYTMSFDETYLNIEI